MFSAGKAAAQGRISKPPAQDNGTAAVQEKKVILQKADSSVQKESDASIHLKGDTTPSTSKRRLIAVDIEKLAVRDVADQVSGSFLRGLPSVQHNGALPPAVAVTRIWFTLLTADCKPENNRLPLHPKSGGNSGSESPDESRFVKNFFQTKAPQNKIRRGYPRSSFL